MTEQHPEAAVFAPSGRVPNSDLPVLIYRGVQTGGPAMLESLFGRHGWGHAWRNGIYPFHHFHSTAHEVLGIAAGRAKVRLGGEGGCDLAVTRGDVLVLPAGTGHKRIAASANLLVVGAYPEGRRWDLMRADELDDDAYRAALTRIAAVPRPSCDPVTGADGALLRMWAR